VEEIEAKEHRRVLSPEVVTLEHQGVPHHEVFGHPLLTGHPGVANDSAPDNADLPAGALRSQAELGLLAVRKVPLVEEADLFKALPAEDHQGAVGMVGVLPTRATVGRFENRPEPGIDGRKHPVTERAVLTDVAVLSAGEPGPRPGLCCAEETLEAVGLHHGIVRTHDRPIARRRTFVQPAAQTGVGRGTKAGVATQLDDLGTGNGGS